MTKNDVGQSTALIKTLDFVDGKVRDDIIAELRAERDCYREGLRMIAQHDWQQIAAKGVLYTLSAIAEMVDTAGRALNE